MDLNVGLDGWDGTGISDRPTTIAPLKAVLNMTTFLCESISSDGFDMNTRQTSIISNFIQSNANQYNILQL